MKVELSEKDIKEILIAIDFYGTDQMNKVYTILIKVLNENK